MKKKNKKDKKNIAKHSIIIGVSAIMISVWLVISSVFCVIAINTTKNNMCNTAQKSFDALVERIDANVPVSYDYVNHNINITKCNLDYVFTIDKALETTCGADGSYDSDIQIVAYIPGNEDFLIMDSDKSIYTTYFSKIPDVFSKEAGETATPNVPAVVSGLIDYQSFRDSISDEQYKSIIQYLNTKKDADGRYYELRCTEFYYDNKAERIIPKTVEITTTKQNQPWYKIDKAVKTYELTPKNVDNLPLGVIDNTKKNVIPGQFVLGTFSSGGLIKEPYTSTDYYEPSVQASLVDKLFTYVYYDFDTITLSSPDVHGQYFTGYNDYLSRVSDTDNLNITINLNFAKRINVLNESKRTLIIGISLITLVLFIIGSILATMLWKIAKTQIEEDQKRREITNALAHDIKTPLFIISGYAQNLKDSVNEEKKDHYCDRIIERTNEVNSLVHKMLDFSKLSSVDNTLNLENVDLNRLLDDVLKDYETLPQKKNITRDTNADCTINADRALMLRAVSYLLDNAIKHSDKNSDIDIKLSKNSLSISNKCSNITTEDIKHLTEPYYRVEKNRESKGNGLGLSIVKSIVESHSFKLDITLNDNTITFTIVFHK